MTKKSQNHSGSALESLVDKARILDEALPYFQNFRGAAFVIKLGGAAMVDEASMRGVLRDVTTMQTLGIRVILVHGGGPEISKMMGRLGLKPRFVRGLRVTDEETMDVAEMVLDGNINGEIVRSLNNLGCLAVGLSGGDGRMLECRPASKHLGQVGVITHVRGEVLRILRENGVVPVVAPIGVDQEGRRYNVNADHVAGALAAEVDAAKLILMTDVPGVLVGSGSKSRLVSTLRGSEARRLIKTGAIHGGMVPKVEACLEALAGGTGKAHILDGRARHALLLEIFTSSGIGTEIVR